MDNEPDAFAALSAAGRITNERGRLIVDADLLKRRKLLDIIQRVISNPHNAREVADEIALDWSPMIHVGRDGKMEIVVGSGKRR